MTLSTIRTFSPSSLRLGRQGQPISSSPYSKSSAAFIAVFVGSSLACSKATAPSDGAAGTGHPPRGVTLAAPSAPQQTTRGDTALRNLSDRIETLAQRMAGGKTDLGTRSRLAESLLTRAQFLGTFADFAQALAIGKSAVTELPDQAQAHAVYARALGAVHRFREAERELDAADRLGFDSAPQRVTIHIAEARELEAALLFAKHRAVAAPSLTHLSLWANAEAALGNFEAADAHYLAALASYHDVAPFPIANVSFQRGVMWAEMADLPERALPCYAEAVRRLPQYVAANVHLAELEVARGERASAIERLRRIVDHTSDPEPHGQLGGLLLAEHPDDPRGLELLASARAGYDQLLLQHRSAFLDHAAEFFAGPAGDPTRASSLARENLELRRTPRAHALAIEATLAAGDMPLACRLIEAALPSAGQSANLRALLEREGARCLNPSAELGSRSE